MPEAAHGASFRDPSGFIYEHAGVVYRQVNRSFADDYDRLMDSGLYAQLVSDGLLLPHEEVPPPTPVADDDPERYRTLAPEPLGFVSYPYEWSFSQLKDAALTTLRIAREALRHGMILRDASAYNIQFVRGRPIFIDTLSFERHVEGRPWVAYRQFCQHFLAPLALASYRDVRMLQLFRNHIDGVPLDLARTLLPARAWLNLQLLLHIRVHAGFQRRYAGDTDSASKVRAMPKQALDNLLLAIRNCVRKLDWKPEGTEWADYYEGDSYDAEATAAKQRAVEACIVAIEPTELWDLGANTGEYSRIAAARGIDTKAFDIDPACVERNYREVRRSNETHLLPLLQDVTNPSPALGWAGAERDALATRCRADTVMALALVHHIAISNNVPLHRIAAWFASLAEHLIIEFVPKSDPKVAVLLSTREDVFPDYTEAGFEAAFGGPYEIEARLPLAGSERTLYRMRRRATSTA